MYWEKKTTRRQKIRDGDMTRSREEQANNEQREAERKGRRETSTRIRLKLMYMLMREISSRLLKPQRLIRLTTEEGKQRAHSSWIMYDYCLYLSVLRAAR